jgi:hypothetical protein
VIICGVWQCGQLVDRGVGKRPEVSGSCSTAEELLLLLLDEKALLVAPATAAAVEAAAVEAPAAASLEMLIASATVGNDDEAVAIGVAVTNGGSFLCAEPTFSYSVGVANCNNICKH